MKPDFGYDKNSFSRAKSTISDASGFAFIRQSPGRMQPTAREGDIVALVDSGDDDSGDEYEKIKAARLKRLRERDRVNFGTSIESSPRPRLSTGLSSESNKGHSSSIRSYMFSDMSFEDEEDLDLPSAPVGRISGHTAYLDHDPLHSYPPEAMHNESIPFEDEVVDLEVEKQPQRIVAKFRVHPIPPLNDVMTTFKAKIAEKKAAITEAQDAREQMTERIRTLKDELTDVKARIDNARRRYEMLDDKALQA